MTDPRHDGSRLDGSRQDPESAVLVLEDGRLFRGRAFGARGAAFGEAVFSTAMTGYQETLTDPSYRRQVVVATAPQIGNTGWVTDSQTQLPADPSDNGDDNESGRIWVSAYVVRDLSPRPSNWRATGDLAGELERQGIVGLAGVDTRTLTRHLRTAGVMRSGVFSGDAVAGQAEMVAAVRAQPGMAGADLTGEVTAAAPVLVPAVGQRRAVVAALDLGIKANTPTLMSLRGMDVHVLPATASMADVEALGVDGVFLSNGPGDPATADRLVELTREILTRRLPLFGICFGNQILGRALGFPTYKLAFGHRGINQPVIDHATGRVLVTSHNHGFAVRAAAGQVHATEFGRARVGFSALNDDVVEGLECLDVPAFSVQFHPEAAAGPHDARYLFDRFLALMAGTSAGPGASPRSPAPGPAATAVH